MRVWPPEDPLASETRGHLSLAEVGTEEFLQKLTSQITEMVSAKITQGERLACIKVLGGVWGMVTKGQAPPCLHHEGPRRGVQEGSWPSSVSQSLCPSQAAGARR